jgi:hypothetical protein
MRARRSPDRGISSERERTHHGRSIEYVERRELLNFESTMVCACQCPDSSQALPAGLARSSSVTTRAVTMNRWTPAVDNKKPARFASAGCTTRSTQTRCPNTVRVSLLPSDLQLSSCTRTFVTAILPIACNALRMTALSITSDFRKRNSAYVYASIDVTSIQGTIVLFLVACEHIGIGGPTSHCPSTTIHGVSRGLVLEPEAPG